MKITSIALLAAAVVTGVSAKQPSPFSAPVVTVCMDQSGELTENDIYAVQAEASEIFSAVPVRIEWKSGRACQASDAVHIHLPGRTHLQAFLLSLGIRPEQLLPDTLAFALPYQGTEIAIFFDRVCAMVGPNMAPHLLAYVMVHEITHLLQGEARHSETGIMKPHWSEADYKAMWNRCLAFAPEDVELIRVGVKARSERLLAAAHVGELR